MVLTLYSFVQISDKVEVALKLSGKTVNIYQTEKQLL